MGVGGSFLRIVVADKELCLALVIDGIIMIGGFSNANGLSLTVALSADSDLSSSFEIRW